MVLIGSAAGLALALLVGVAVVGILVFEVLMFIDVIKNPRLSDNEKILWAAGMLFLHPVVAIAYYFVAYSKRVK